MKKLYWVMLGLALVVWLPSCGKPQTAKDSAAKDESTTKDGRRQSQNPPIHKDGGGQGLAPPSDVSEVYLEPENPEEVTITNVYDGDTYTTSDGRKVRLIGIDTPEKRELMGAQVTEHVKKLLARGKVYLEPGKGKKDRYGRSLGYFYVKVDGKYLQVNAYLVLAGMAEGNPYKKKHRFRSLFTKLHNQARKTRSGIWQHQHFWDKSRRRHAKKRKKSELYSKKAYQIASRFSTHLKASDRVYGKPQNRQKKTYTVSKVMDGDTAELSGLGRVRLLGVDTPEKKEPFADKAKEFLENLVLKKRVYIEYDANKKDRYGRHLVHIFVKKGKRYIFINAQLIKSGLAQKYFISPNKRYQELFAELQQQAIKKNRGKWAIASEILAEKEYLASRKKFHRPSCPNARRLAKPKVYTSRQKCLDNGLSPARCCNP